MPLCTVCTNRASARRSVEREISERVQHVPLVVVEHERAEHHHPRCGHEGRAIVDPLPGVLDQLGDLVALRRIDQRADLDALVDAAPDRLAPLLADRYTVVTFDNRETGGTGPCEDGFTLAVLTLALVLVITATYHLGYEQFREDGIGPPETGNTIISIPALLTTNPLGSVIAHTSMHVAADIHAYETDTYLPPQTEADD